MVGKFVGTGHVTEPDMRSRRANVKKIALAASFSVCANAAFAGGLIEPVMEPAVVEAKTASSAGGILIPLLILILVAVAVSSSGGSDTVLTAP